MTLRAGLTGGIGSGKSSASHVFESLGVPVIDTDRIARELTAPQGAALPMIREAFGDILFAPAGTLDRASLRKLVFSNPVSKKKLESILHPLIRQEAADQFACLSAKSSVVVFDIPLLAPGSPWLQGLQRVLVIDCLITTQIERVISRSGWSKEQVKSIIAQQITRNERLSIATDIITNEHITLDEFASEVRAVCERWRTLAASCTTV